MRCWMAWIKTSSQRNFLCKRSSRSIVRSANNSKAQTVCPRSRTTAEWSENNCIKIYVDTLQKRKKNTRFVLALSPTKKRSRHNFLSFPPFVCWFALICSLSRNVLFPQLQLQWNQTQERKVTLEMNNWKRRSIYCHVLQLFRSNRPTPPKLLQAKLISYYSSILPINRRKQSSMGKEEVIESSFH